MVFRTSRVSERNHLCAQGVIGGSGLVARRAAAARSTARARDRPTRGDEHASSDDEARVMAVDVAVERVDLDVERKRALGERMVREIPSAQVDALLASVRSTLDACGEDARAWCDRDTAERFLRADKGDLDKARKRLQRTLRWRDETKPGALRCERCFEGDFMSHYMQQIGFDAYGRAVVYSDIGLALDGRPASNVEHCVQVLELLEKFLPKYPYDQYIWVCDFHKFGTSNMNPTMAMKCLSLFARSYPERLEMMIFVEAPKLFNGLYRLLTSFVDPVTVQKLRFIKGPEGKGGGGLLEETFDEFFSEETSKWLVTEMRMNRHMWSVVKTKKSWIRSMMLENGVMEEAAAYPEFSSHDCRGTAEFLNSPAGLHATAFAKSHGMRSKLVANTLPQLCAPVESEAKHRESHESETQSVERLTRTFSFIKAGEVVDLEAFDRFD